MLLAIIFSTGLWLKPNLNLTLTYPAGGICYSHPTVWEISEGALPAGVRAAAAPRP